ncbi:HEWD family protein [Haloarchaeobius salinus]|uniref:HEWD family protein n=1 Tax=Haloarchaeobius salinus TaxID=1198298 RepID=UPI00210B7CAC|nr:HEWD family protein [Haloarchaeobius salinus]
MTELKRPTARTCERCGRQERWDDDSESWRVADGEVGERFCIHEWDINGTFNPVAE